jgi:hypothetical protein
MRLAKAFKKCALPLQKETISHFLMLNAQCSMLNAQRSMLNAQRSIFNK